MSGAFKATVAMLLIAIMLVPQYVAAADEVPVTETIDLDPYSNDCDEIENVANDTIEYNIDTWDPLPEGIFVGGTIKESLMRLHEVGTGPENYLTLSSIVRFQPEYLSTGSSEFILRMPVFIDPTHLPTFAQLKIYRVASPAAFQEGVDVSGYQSTVACSGNIEGNMANLRNHFHDPVIHSVWSDISYPSWISNNRLYARIIAPIVTDEIYAFVLKIVYPTATPFDIYFCPDDLASDNITASGVYFKWLIDPSAYYVGGQDVTADLGWSFVFQKGIGETARSYTQYFDTNDYLSFYKWVKVDNDSLITLPWGEKALGSATFSFIMEFREELDSNWTITASVYDVDLWTYAFNNTIINPTYWTNITFRNALILSDNASRNYFPRLIDGNYWLLFWFNFKISKMPEKVDLMTYYDRESPGTELTTPWGTHLAPTANMMRFVTIHLYDHINYTTNHTDIFFSSYSTVLLIYGSALNYTKVTPMYNQGHNWQGLKEWVSEHWIDLMVSSLIFGPIGGIYYTYLTDVGGVWGAAAFGGVVGVMLYEMMPTIRNIVGAIGRVITGTIKMIIDGILTLGTWIWKIGEAIWAAMTWLWDQLSYYGSILIGLLIVGIAMALFFYPIKWQYAFWLSALALTKGDVEKAKRELEGPMNDIKGVGKRLGGG